MCNKIPFVESCSYSHKTDCTEAHLSNSVYAFRLVVDDGNSGPLKVCSQPNRDRNSVHTQNACTGAVHVLRYYPSILSVLHSHNCELAHSPIAPFGTDKTDCEHIMSVSLSQAQLAIINEKSLQRSNHVRMSKVPAWVAESKVPNHM